MDSEAFGIFICIIGTLFPIIAFIIIWNISKKIDRKINDNAPPIVIRSLYCGHMKISATPLEVIETTAGGADFAGGVDIRCTFKNNSHKVIKYVTFVFNAYNAVGDRVQCEIKHSFESTGKFTGPLNPGLTSSGSQVYRGMFYNASITKIKIARALVEYMDGTTYEQTTFNG